MEKKIQTINNSELQKFATECQSMVQEAMQFIAEQKAKIAELESSVKHASSALSKAVAENMQLKAEISNMSNLEKQASISVDEDLLTGIVKKLARSNFIDSSDIEYNIEALKNSPKLAFTVLDKVTDTLISNDHIMSGSFVPATKTASTNFNKAKIPESVLAELEEFERQNFS